ncbi:hypothetical protein [Thiohalorhabdus sp.]|uniref:hypothetical protein n=1 Tax=Thiohalorhabdus sp. TaxID=3094134 RepID=UPI002FC37409
MGETVATFRPSFNRSLIVEAREDNQSSDGGLVLVREVLERAGSADVLLGSPITRRWKGVAGHS